MCKHNNPGTAPFSEPETRAVKVPDKLQALVMNDNFQYFLVFFKPKERWSDDV